MDYQIITADYNSPYLEQLKKWFESEWKREYIFHRNIPNPLIALSGERLLGGLAFTEYPNPEKEGMALWINALFVKQENRKSGIASDLISAANEMTGSVELYVLTHIPLLYQKSGWTIISVEEKNSVLKAPLP
ncbi:GNAT family N-acetyltransferase [Spirochaeta isovalerica]|uniref:GNAT superfamily N-acetyltransferase n=1 Tax=Spirochaeta isovalerica TaxID=150 RepID=A0A841R6P9_9SPIO|nr:GNAT family N-acetyltransferase [Spirochaeta isovalerica]MBB6479516.1 GNAT superfamily N-acetyltransferase [Spirochaeta isovalerica]